MKDVERVLNRAKFGRPTNTEPKFKPGDKVRCKNINPATHTRLPRYVRGHVGVVELNHGTHVFPDSASIDGTENPQWLYTVVFDEPRAVGRGRRSDHQDFDRRVRAVSRPGMTSIDPTAAKRAARASPRAFPATPKARCSASRGRRRPSP